MKGTSISDHSASAGQHGRYDKAAGVMYTQDHVDMIREQLLAAEAAKRKFLLLLTVVAFLGLVGSLAFLGAKYAQFALAKSELSAAQAENASLKSELQKAKEALQLKEAQEARSKQAIKERDERLSILLPKVLRDEASGAEIGEFAQLVSSLPDRKIEVERMPPDKLFRNWRVIRGGTVEIYSLIGGFVQGRWVIYSNLVGASTARSASQESSRPQ